VQFFSSVFSFQLLVFGFHFSAGYKMCQSRAWVKMAKTATQMAKMARGDGVWTVLTRLAAHELHMNGKNSWLQAPGYWMP